MRTLTSETLKREIPKSNSEEFIVVLLWETYKVLEVNKSKLYFQ